MNKLKTMVAVALLIALEVVLSRFCSIATPVVKIGFAFVPLAVCGMLYGPVWALIAGGLADLIGALLFPIGAYFPGFTLSNALIGLIFGLFLFRRFTGWRHILPAVLLSNFVISLLLSTYWLHLITGSPYLGLLPVRLAQNAILAPIEFAVIRLIQGPMGRLREQTHS